MKREKERERERERNSVHAFSVASSHPDDKAVENSQDSLVIIMRFLLLLLLISNVSLGSVPTGGLLRRSSALTPEACQVVMVLGQSSGSFGVNPAGVFGAAVEVRDSVPKALQVKQNPRYFFQVRLFLNNATTAMHRPHTPRVAAATYFCWPLATQETPLWLRDSWRLPSWSSACCW